ncbi:MAG TPA: LemA family protein, partial [Vicinamibacterales bacterium]|nr:LemA family protein [Vicinamibacterales bacterium]
MTLWLAVAVPLLVVVVGIILYNRLVAARQRVREAWSSIDVQLQRRASLIPNLVQAVKGYAEYEKGTLEKVVQARAALGTASGPRASAQANAELSAALTTFFAVAEAY